MKLIRNFSIIAHIDHGKSTLADRFIQLCGGLEEREMEAQVLDSMDLERERGITIKAQSVSLRYKARDGETYQLNMIDTPGHVDFSYEVSRSLAACEGALLVVDAAQGVEAQSVANCYTAIEQGLEVLPVLNKIDLPSADPPKVIKEIEEIIGIEAQDALRVSAKTGENVPELLEELVRRIPPPRGDPEAPLQALIIDSWFDNYVGVVSLVRVMNGSLRTGQKIRVWSTGRAHQVDKLGRFTPKSLASESLETGEVGFVIAGIREIDGAPVGDTITLDARPASEPLAGLQEGAAARLRRPVPGEVGRLRKLPRRAGEAQAQRLGAALRAGSLDRARLRFPLRLPRAAAHGHRAGAAGARVQPDAGHERADGHVRDRAHRRQHRVRRQPGEAAAEQRNRRPSRADHHGQHSAAARARRRGHQAVHGQARQADQDALRGQPGVVAVRDAARRRSCWTSSTA